MPRRQFYVYVLSSRTRVLYIGMMSQLAQRMTQHRARTPGSFVARYNVTRLVYCEIFQEASQAVRREREMKAWRRAKKVALILRQNPEWRDLAGEWRLD